MSNAKPYIVWLRQDLRVADNPALVAAVDSGHPVQPVFILDDGNAGEWRMGAASRWWLHESLNALNRSLGGQLRCYVGNARDILPRLAADICAEGVTWNRCYEPWRIARDRDIEEKLTSQGVYVEHFNSSLLFEPPTVQKSDGTPYKVFTPFFRKGCLGAPAPGQPVGAPALDRLDSSQAAQGVDMLGLMPSIPWYKEMAECWQPGEDGAHARLQQFLESGIVRYKEGRDRPDQAHVSRLSPHLHFGEISPRQVWHATLDFQAREGFENDVDHFLRELGWREFSYSLLYHWPELPGKNLQSKFDRFPWREDPVALESWQRGQTGYPIVDAGMRELWRTGYMHNRVRMIVGSFLVKNLMLHWHHGEEWFWDTLVDADLANNSASWQWIAGCGADAAPYFRIFNPVIQGRKFDPGGDYVCKHIPELARLPTKYLHSPWDAPTDVLDAAGVDYGRDYPQPIVDLKATRARALEAFSSLSAS
ncbi:MAG: deoxyribodipyrimidine photo-lyase [Woeseiaceae bacterium]|nr:deoxyribodipyrimidine photo-lyase [Woeseiaceae bacterium]